MQLTFTGTYKGTVLNAELLAAFPEWVVPDPNDPSRFLAVHAVHTSPNLLVVTVPVGTNVASVNAVVNAHDPAVEDFHEQRDSQRAIDKSSAEAKLKAPPLSLTQAEIDALHD